MVIKKFKVENFRGISLPIEFDLKNNSSLVIFGKNGSGKSSIVDSWEWLHNQKIDHLAREGAGEADYPNRNSDGGNTYLEIEFLDPKIDNIKIQYNKKKIKDPIITGDYSAFKEKARHPFHLRYKDLQQFVYFTKTDKYKYLAKYLGFDSLILFQEKLLTTDNKLEDKLNKLSVEYEQAKVEVKSYLDTDDPTTADVLTFLNAIAIDYKQPTIDKLSGSKALILNLKDLVANDPKAKELSVLKELEQSLNRFYPIHSLTEKIENLEALFSSLKSDEKSIKNLLLVNLYGSSLEVLENNYHDGGACPLCDEVYLGNLISHIQNKHHTLKDLQAKKNNFLILQNELKSIFKDYAIKCKLITQEINGHIEFQDFAFLNKLCSDELNKALTIIDKDIVEIKSISISQEPFVARIEQIINFENKARVILTDKIKILESDSSIKDLSNDYQRARQSTIAYFNFRKLSKQVTYLSNVKCNFSQIVESFNNFIRDKMQESFNKIASNVVTYFEILEEDSAHIKNPTVNLITGKNKAVELEIEFVSKKVSPAFKVLSESQVNSFGLSIFLASIKIFNENFKFIILDDIINSFDAHKRPKVLSLIKANFPDHQFLILTHDQIWYDQIQHRFPDWIKYKFQSWDSATGPKYKLAKNSIEEIIDELNDDENISAGQKLGRYLEWRLQEINQNLQTAIKYRIDNQYSMIELFNPLKKRIKDLLSERHLLYKLFSDLDGLTSFRNYSAHYKNSSTEFTSSELLTVVNLWIQIENGIICQSSSCDNIPLQHESNGIRCKNCGFTLTKM
jgi:recombinational DNA repair ATPase RecF